MAVAVVSDAEMMPRISGGGDFGEKYRTTRRTTNSTGSAVGRNGPRISAGPPKPVGLVVQEAPQVKPVGLVAQAPSPVPPVGLVVQASPKDAEVPPAMKMQVCFLLDQLDEEALWKLAGELQVLGLICAADLPPPPVMSTCQSWNAAPIPLKAVDPPSTAPSPTTLPIGPPIGSGATAAPEISESPCVTLEELLAVPSGRDEHRTSAPSSNSPVGSGEQFKEAKNTTVVLRNLPAHYDQVSCQKLINECGYEACYDFLLWFPAKTYARVAQQSANCGYAFVNFRTANLADEFKLKFHGKRVETSDDGAESAGGETEPALSIAVAKVQGFASNYRRFQHLLEGNQPTRCQPFFARDAIERLRPEDKKSDVPQPIDPLASSGLLTTIVIRNLPRSIEHQVAARQWFDSQGYSAQYDFFLYIMPSSRPKRGDSSAKNSKQDAEATTLAYAFVNFLSSQAAERCLLTMKSQQVEGEQPLNVVYARVQGLELLKEHFCNPQEGKRLLPWIAGKKAEPVEQKAEEPKTFKFQ
eukprot:gnl/TRDRNA2_/TRDRNA2_92210_c1_seq1.p1 gnl/TRDRNA2_/TRDRNA2_92210_c1~~gnl/TRDRNA2_/TRDRNA2_92210_c1_seq1.p1  ORF type:complete len:526 (+),score=113.51 gnl/TRDRNA2_/TRDRNA2_92210_c1_seq1:53-1630(+)